MYDSHTAFAVLAILLAAGLLSALLIVALGPWFAALRHGGAECTLLA